MTLLEAMLDGGSVRNMGEIVLVVLGHGRGGLVTFPLEFAAARKWADGRSATGVEYRDLNLFMDKFENCIARAGSSLPTKGHPVNLLKIAREMKSAGLELGEWNLPHDVRKAMRPQPPKPALAGNRPGQDEQETEDKSDTDTGYDRQD